MIDVDASINELDLSLFEAIPSQTTDLDKRSLLACQAAVRDLVPHYTYLEIGSYLGGSLQPHLLDPECARIYSIDKRPRIQADERGYDWEYRNNSTARMFELLKKVQTDTGKITAIDGDTREIDPASIAEGVDLCFIDGEHTDPSASADLAFCRKVLNPNGAIIFHDAHIIYNAIATAIEGLEKEGVDFRAYVLPHTVFVIEMGDFPMHRHPSIAALLLENRHSYLFALQENDRFRRFATQFPLGTMRRLMARIRGGNFSE